MPEKGQPKWKKHSNCGNRDKDFKENLFQVFLLWDRLFTEGGKTEEKEVKY